MQHCVNPTRWKIEEDQNISLEMEDNPNSFQMEEDLNFVLGNHGSLFLECNLILT